MPKLAAHDVVTGLASPLLLHDRLVQALAQGRRQNGLLALMRIDLVCLESGDAARGDGGHARMLQDAAARLRALVRESDTIARTDEGFVLILPDLSGPHAATAMASKLVAAVEQALVMPRDGPYARAHLGFALFPAHGDTPARLLRNAGVAVAQARAAGLRVHRFADAGHPMDPCDATRELARAIEQGQLRLEYQPQIDLRQGRPVGLEALLRWRHPTLGEVDPQTFVDLAEASGQIGRIGKWALTQACAAAAAWPTAIRVAVNVSMAQMVGDDLPRVVARALERSRLQAARLELEITERSVLGDGERSSERVLAVLTRLRALGVRLALDDFGMGHASLRHLGRFPVDALKIDRSFVADLPGARGHAIVHCVIELAHRMGLRVTAEGIEHEAQLATLRALGCDEAQGHILGKPLAAAEVAPWLLAAADRLPPSATP